MENDLLIIFIRNPVLNKVKTRLSEKTGSKIALAVYHELLSATFKNAAIVNSKKTIYFSEKVDVAIETRFSFEPHIQEGVDLGERMSNAFKDSFRKGYDKVVLIGSDCYELTPGIISEAFKLLITVDCVIGPAVDGGYYLIGLRKVIPELFSGINWGTDEVFKQTITLLQKKKVEYHMLTVLRDIDTLDDVLKYSNLQSLLHD